LYACSEVRALSAHNKGDAMEEKSANNTDSASAEAAPIVKKTITFNLPREKTPLTIGYFVELGFNRKHIVMLFEKLQSLDFGKFEKGRKGRGLSSKFIPAKNCPEVYLLDIEQKKRGRKGTRHD
jgi:hypothetical protein